MNLLFDGRKNRTASGSNELLLVLLCLALFNAQIKPLLAWVIDKGVFPNLITAACALAGIVLWQVSKPRIEFTQQTTAALFLAGVLTVLPIANTSWIALALLGWVCLELSNSRRQRNAALVIVAASLRTPTAQIGFDLLAGPMLWVDTVVAGLFGKIFAGGVRTSENLIQTDGAHSLLVMSGCASFANISLMLLTWFTAVRILGREEATTRLSVAFGLAASGIIANCIRIGLMSLSDETYEIIHGDVGSSIWVCIYATSVLTAVHISTRAK